MNAVCVFSGPTIGAEEVKSRLDAQWRPPAAQGDIYLAVRDGADIIVLIDGLFQNTPSVWHKEILWALANGVAVVGASSMGALRAAELHSFGMVGVGKVFDAYRDGTLTCDDEVALLHGPQELGFRALTTTLVDMRATFRAAVAKGVISVAQHRTLVDAAKALPYWERSYPALLTRDGSPVDDAFQSESLETLRLWIAEHAVHQKHADAVEALGLVAAGGVFAHPINFHFESSSAWRQFVVEATPTANPYGGRELCNADATALAELSLNPRLHDQICAAVECDANAHADGNALVRKLEESGLAADLSARGEDKRRWLGTDVGNVVTYASAMTTPQHVYTWFFEEHCRLSIPVDLPAYATRHGFDSVAQLSVALLHEYLYCNSSVENNFPAVGEPGR